MAAWRSTRPLTVNRLCGSGLQAIVSAAQTIMLGDADIAIGGGSESMSRAPYTVPAARFGQRMGDGKLVDMMLGALHDPFQTIHMGVTAENVAASRATRRMRWRSNRIVARSRKALQDQILPISIRTKKGEVAFDTDEHVRLEASADDFTKLKPVFQKENGTVTAGNASGINDAAAAVLMMSADAARAQGREAACPPLAYAHAGVDPAYMGIGPVPATQKALERAGLKISDLDVIEANEAFAAQACAVTQEPASIRRRSTRTARASRSATRSVRPAR